MNLWSDLWWFDICLDITLALHRCKSYVGTKATYVLGIWVVRDCVASSSTVFSGLRENVPEFNCLNIGHALKHITINCGASLSNTNNLTSCRLRNSKYFRATFV